METVKNSSSNKPSFFKILNKVSWALVSVIGYDPTRAAL